MGYLDWNQQECRRPEYYQPTWLNIYRTLHLTIVEYIFFFQVHMDHSQVVHMVGHNPSLNKFKRIKIILSIVSNHMELN